MVNIRTNDPYAVTVTGSNRPNLFSIDENRVTVKEMVKKNDICNTGASLVRLLQLRTYHLMSLSGLLLIVILYVQRDIYIARRMDKQLSQGIEGGIKVIKQMNHSLSIETTTSGTGNGNITGFVYPSRNSAFQPQTYNNSVNANVTTDKAIRHNWDGTAIRHRNKTLNVIGTHANHLLNQRDHDTHVELFAKKKSTWRVYKFPVKPLYNIKSILKESIGTKILNNHKKNPLRNCSPTVQFTITLPVPFTWNKNTNGSIWTLQSMMIQTSDDNAIYSAKNKTGTSRSHVVPKTYGGDEIYVEWESDTGTDMGIAQITDMLDGTYQLIFIRPPILQHNYTSTVNQISTTENNVQLGRLTIYYDYTCNIGSIVAPGKDSFRRAGEIHLSFTNMNVPEPFIHDFIPPNTIRRDVEGQQKPIDLSQYHTVIAFGDSLMLQFVRQYKLGGFWSSNIIYEQNVGQCLSNQKDFEEMIEKFYTWHNDQIIHLQNLNYSAAVILGSAVWDAMRGCVRDDFMDHRNAIRKFITAIRTKYPQIAIYWKSPSAIVLHRRNSLSELIDNPIWLQRSRYISDGVPRQIYHVQKSLMNELHVPFLDLYDAYYLSAPWSLPGDCRHYSDEISSLFLSYFWPGLNRSKVYYLKDNQHKLIGISN
jgi:hypothetical protein